MRPGRPARPDVLENAQGEAASVPVEGRQPVVSAPLSDSGSGEGASLGRQVGRGAIWSVASNITLRLASIAITALLARLLSKEDFGTFAIALAVYLVVASLAELGMGSAIARSAREPEDIAPTVASISILVSAGLSLGMYLGAPALATALGQPAATQPIQVLSLCLFLTGLFTVPGAQLVREFRQDRIFLATVVGFVVANPLLVVMAVNGGGATAFAWSRVIGQIATGLVFYFSTSRRYRPGWRSECVGPLIRFGLPLSIANLVNWALLNADFMILGRMVSSAEVGVYMIAFNVASWSTALLGSVMNNVVVPAFGRVSDDRARLGKALVSGSQLVALVAFPVGALTCALAAPLILTLFGDKWSEAAPVLAVLSVYGVLYTFSLLLVSVLVAAGRTGRLLAIQLMWISALVPAMVIGVQFWSLEGVAWAHVLTIGCLALPAYVFFVLRVAAISLAEFTRSVARPIAAAMAAGGVAWLVSRCFGPSWAALIAGGLAGGLTYLVVVAPVLARVLPHRFVPSWVPRRWRVAVESPEGS